MRAVTRSWMVGVCAAIVGVAVLGVLSRTTKAFNPQPDPPGFGMIGIAEGQTARLNLVNIGTVGIPPGPCRATLEFFDGAGNVLASRRVRVLEGNATSLDFELPAVQVNGDATVATPLRAEIRAAVAPIDNGVPPGPCRATVEIFDTATGRTSVLLPPDPCRGGVCRAE